MAMGICRQGSLSGGELGREIPSAVRGTVQLPFFFNCGYDLQLMIGMIYAHFVLVFLTLPKLPSKSLISIIYNA
ncbi:hypothetical protein Hanom_Chr11g01019611 [Helianthus anomalus]